ncbi:MAG: stage II sporulation protein M [Candidatus Aenigmatarchaeota archaeon]
MLERFWVEEEKEEHFSACFGLSMVFSFIAIFIAYFLVPFKVSGKELTGLLAVVLTSLAAAYPLIKYLEDDIKETEEERKKSLKDEFDLLERHKEEVVIYLAFFLGVAFAFGLFNSFFPEAFGVQHEVIGEIRPDVVTGRVVDPGFFTEILTKNISVFFITFILSLFLAAGMVFILVWNASILGVFISEVSKSLVEVPAIVLSYLPHGVLEVSAYIVAGLSGFFLSHELREAIEWEDRSYALKLMSDSLLLLGLGFLLLLAGALLESVGTV